MNFVFFQGIKIERRNTKTELSSPERAKFTHIGQSPMKLKKYKQKKLPLGSFNGSKKHKMFFLFNKLKILS